MSYGVKISSSTIVTDGESQKTAYWLYIRCDTRLCSSCWEHLKTTSENFNVDSIEHGHHLEDFQVLSLPAHEIQREIVGIMLRTSKGNKRKFQRQFNCAGLSSWRFSGPFTSHAPLPSSLQSRSFPSVNATSLRSGSNMRCYILCEHCF